jgi:hypothetical protein
VVHQPQGKGVTMSVLADNLAFNQSVADSRLSRAQRELIDLALLDDERVLVATAAELKRSRGHRVSGPPRAGALAVTDRRLLVLDPDSTRAAERVTAVPFFEIEQIAYLHSMTGRKVILCTRQGTFVGTVRRGTGPAEDFVATLQAQIEDPY